MFGFKYFLFYYYMLLYDVKMVQCLGQSADVINVVKGGQPEKEKVRTHRLTVQTV